MAELQPPGMSHRRLAWGFFLIALVPAALCGFLHLVNIGHEGIQWYHAVSAVFANWFGPWGVLVVRISGFPNAGLRSFNLPLSLGLTALLAGFFLVSWKSRSKRIRILCLFLFVPFAFVWFALGLFQIADGHW